MSANFSKELEVLLIADCRWCWCVVRPIAHGRHADLALLPSSFSSSLLPLALQSSSRSSHARPFTSLCSPSFLLTFAHCTDLFQQSGLQDPFLATLIIFVILNVFIYVSFFVIEFVGRRVSSRCHASHGVRLT